MSGPNRAEEAGFTVVELLVAMLVGGVLLSAIAAVTVAMLRTGGFVTTTGENLDDARISVERMRQDLRGARRIQGTGPAGATTDADQLAFWTDRDQDRVADAAEQIVYQLRTVDGVGRLERYSGAATTPVPIAIGLDLSDDGGVPRSRFAYDATPVGDTTVVTVVLTLDNPGDERAAPLVVTETLRLRNAPND